MCMLTGLGSLEQFWQRSRNNLSVISHSHHKNFWLFESSVWFHMLANSMLAIYIPILMLQNGFDLTDILFFYFIFHIINAPANILGGYLVSQIGAKKTIIIATLFQIAFFIWYSVLEPGTLWGLVALGALGAIYDALYYTASMYLFMQTTTDVNNSGKNTGILYAIVRSAGLIGPIIGSTILLLGGNPGWVILAVIVSFVISILPLFWTSLEQGDRAVMMPIREFIKEPYVIANHISLGLYKIHESIGAIVWPVFIYLYFGTLESIAIIAVMIPIVGLITSYASGWINLRWRYHAIALSALLVGLVWVGRIMFEGGLWYYGSIAFVATIMILMQVPIDANIFRAGNQTNPLTASVFKNMFSMGTKAILFGILYVSSLSFNDTFTIAAIAMGLLVTLNIYRIHLKSRTQSSCLLYTSDAADE